MRLDVRRLDLDEDHSASADGFQSLREGRNRNTGSQLAGPQSIERSGGNGDRIALRHTFRVKRGIVMHYDNPIAGGVNVELHRLRAQSEGGFEGRYRVFGKSVVGAAVRNPERGGAAVGQRYSVE